MIRNGEHQQLITLLTHADAGQRRLAAESLAEARSALVSSVLALALQDEDNGVRDSAARSLLGMKNTAAACSIAEYLVDTRFVTRNLASSLLLQFGDCAVEPLLTYAVHPHPDVRKLAIDTLGLIGDARALPVLVSLVNDSDENVVLAVVEALGNIKDPSVIPHLAMIFATYDYARTVAAEAMGKIGNESASPFLLTQLERYAGLGGEEQLVSFALAEALAEAGTPGAADALVRLCQNASGKLRNIFLFALVCIAERHGMDQSHFSVLSQRFQEALQDDDTRVVIASVKALIGMMDAGIEDQMIALIGRNEMLDQLILTNLQGGGRSFVALVRKYHSFTTEQKKRAIEYILPQLNDLAAVDDEQIQRARQDLFAELVDEWIDSDEELRIVTIDALFYLDDERTVEYFTGLISDTYFWLRMRVLELLAHITHYRSADVLSQFLDDGDEMVRSFVRSVLVSRGLILESSERQDLP